MSRAAEFVRRRLRSIQGLSAAITRDGATVTKTVVLGSPSNEAAINAGMAIEHDRYDVLVKASDYGATPQIGDTIVVTLSDGSLLRLGVFVPQASNQCYERSDAEGLELRVFCRKTS